MKLAQKLRDRQDQAINFLNTPDLCLRL